MSGENTRKERAGFYRGFELLPVHIYVLFHLKKAGVDYAKMMAKMSGLSPGLINDAINDLLGVGLIERDPGSAVKRSKARFKKAFEVHKHHTYYRLSREGELFVRLIGSGWRSTSTSSFLRDVGQLERSQTLKTFERQTGRLK